MCFTLRLHTSAAPPRGGLTPALGGRKAFDYFSSQCSFFRLRLGLLFGRVVGTLLLRSSPSGALTHRMRYVGRLRKRCLVWSVCRRLTRSLRSHPAESSRVRARAFPLQFRQLCQGFILRGFLTRLTIRSSRPRVVASVMCFTLRLHMSAAPTQGGLTQALGGRKALGCFAFQHGYFTGFGRCCSPVGFFRRSFFGQVCLARSYITCVALAGFGNGVWCRSVCR